MVTTRVEGVCGCVLDDDEPYRDIACVRSAKCMSSVEITRFIFAIMNLSEEKSEHPVIFS